MCLDHPAECRTYLFLPAFFPSGGPSLPGPAQPSAPAQFYLRETSAYFLWGWGQVVAPPPADQHYGVNMTDAGQLGFDQPGLMAGPGYDQTMPQVTTAGAQYGLLPNGGRGYFLILLYKYINLYTCCVHL